ncbi:interleukin-13 receptor subunit alpha-1-like [Sebastes fasciatus]|uniref:interleukin-13 receptor subunit alpha-1-like n=1 Tax=Sebastes fasciatus TaxID=394691 RepID=UPI003D9F147B
MTLRRDFVAFLTFIMVMMMMMMVCHCKADSPPPPRNLKVVWLDNFTVNVSWLEPDGLSGRDVWYKYRPKDGDDTSVVCTLSRNFTKRLLTEETNSDRWTYLVWTAGRGPTACNSRNPSTIMNITIEAKKPRAEVKDIRCFTSLKERNCSWTPGSQSFNVSYWNCGDNESLKTCDQPYSSATRNGCVLKADFKDDICVHVDFGNKSSSFEAKHEIHSPKMSIREVGDNLNLSWTPPEIGKVCTWKYEVCYKRCKQPEECLELMGQKGEQMPIAYDRSCRYEFKSKVSAGVDCLTVSSDFSDVVHYGTNEPPDETLTVVAIVIPIILSVCMILSCYCFRRHSSIICPIIPDPSAIFKEMMMNGNKELKTTTGSLYTPVPEPIEPCKITLVTENRENS